MNVSMESNAEGTTFGELLKELTKGVKDVNAQHSSRLSKVEGKVDDVEKAISVVSTALDNISDIIKTQQEENKKQNEKLTEHWHNQDMMNRELKEVLLKLTQTESRFGKIEDRQLNGCPSFKNFEKVREEQLKRYEAIIEKLTTASSRNREEIETLKTLVETIANTTSVQAEQIKVQNNRIKDLEADQKKGMWLIIGAFVAIVGTLIKSSM